MSGIDKIEEQGRGARRQGQGGAGRRDRRPRPPGRGPGRPGQGNLKQAGEKVKDVFK